MFTLQPGITHTKILHTKIFLAAAAIILAPTFAQADVTSTVTGDVIQRYNFNSDTGVSVKEDGTVTTSTATSAPGSLSGFLQAEAEAESATSALKMESAQTPPQGVSVQNDAALSVHRLQDSVTIDIMPAE